MGVKPLPSHVQLIDLIMYHQLYSCVCLCNRPPVIEVYLNYEVVLFQPWTVTPPHLGSVAIVKILLSFFPAPPDSTIFLGRSFPSSILPTPTSEAIHRRSTISVCTRSPPPLPARSAAHMEIACTCHPLATNAHICAPRRMPASAAVSCECVPPPFAVLGLHPGPFHPLEGVHLLWVPTSTLCPRLSLS